MKLRTAFSIHAAIWLALQGIPGVADCGPLFHVVLSPGSYEVTASYGGITRHKTVRVGTGATEATLYWPLSDESAAFGASLFAGRR